MEWQTRKKKKQDSPNTNTQPLSMNGNRDDDDNDDNNDVVMWEKTIAEKKHKKRFVNYQSIFKSLDLIDDNIHIMHFGTHKKRRVYEYMDIICSRFRLSLRYLFLIWWSLGHANQVFIFSRFHFILPNTYVTSFNLVDFVHRRHKNTTERVKNYHLNIPDLWRAACTQNLISNMLKWGHTTKLLVILSI